MTVPTDGAPDTARELVTMPEPARGSAREVRELLDAGGQDAGQEAGQAPTFTLEDGGQEGPKRRRSRPGGHKPTKAELEAELEAARRQLAAVTGERPPAEAEAELGLRAALGGTFGAVFNFAASARGGHWRLEPAEGEQLAAAWAPVLAPYMAGSAEYLPWVVAAGVTYSVIEPRLRTDAEKAARRELVVDRPAKPAAPASSTSSSSSSSSPPRPRDPGAVPPDLRTPPADTLADAPHLNGAGAASSTARPLDPPAPIEQTGRPRWSA